MIDNNKNNLYVSPKDYLLLFSSENAAIKAAKQCKEHSGISLEQEFLEGIKAAHRKFSVFDAGKCHITDPGQPIFLIKKSENKSYSGTEFWFVIIGERVGWIIARNAIYGAEIKLLE